MYHMKELLYSIGIFFVVSGAFFVIVSELHPKNSGPWFNINGPLSPWPHWPFQINFTHNYIFGQRILGDR